MSMFTPLIVAAGEALIDLIEEPDGRFNPCLGGSVYNCARALAKQGVATSYLNPFSSDKFGLALAHTMKNDGVELVGGTSILPTSLAVVSLDDKGQAAYTFHREAVADRDFVASHWNRYCAAQTSLRWCYTGCLTLLPSDAPRYIDWLEQQKSNGIKIAIDANARPKVCADIVAYQNSIWRAMSVADLIKVSDDDLVFLGLDTTDPLAAARAVLSRTGAMWVSLTLGAQGALLVSQTQAWRARTTQAVRLVDSVGAGDCFFAGLLSQISRSMAPSPTMDYSFALHYAVANASLSLMRKGCQPPTAEETLTYLDAVQLDTL